MLSSKIIRYIKLYVPFETKKLKVTLKYTEELKHTKKLRYSAKEY